jgi:hypothetical protein
MPLERPGKRGLNDYSIPPETVGRPLTLVGDRHSLANLRSTAAGARSRASRSRPSHLSARPTMPPQAADWKPPCPRAKPWSTRLSPPANRRRTDCKSFGNVGHMRCVCNYEHARGALPTAYNGHRPCAFGTSSTYCWASDPSAATAASAGSIVQGKSLRSGSSS